MDESITESDYQFLFDKIRVLKVNELMQEPYDDDMLDDDFWSLNNV